MSTPEVGAVVIGGGIAGIAAALELQREVREVVLVDASDRPGGVLRTDHASGFVVERGPNTVQVKAPMRAFLEREAHADALVRAQPASRHRFVFHDGRLTRVPMSPLGLASTRLLSTRAKLRLLAEPFVRRGDPGSESVAEFAGRRLGREVVTNLMGPFLTGVYAGDEEQLGAEAVIPSLVEWEGRTGSLASGAFASALRRGRPRGLRGTYSAAEGLGPFARSLAARLVEPPALGNRVTGLRRDGSQWSVVASGEGGESRLRTSRVVIAAPAPEAADLLGAACPEVAEALGAIAYAPIVSIPLGVTPDAVREPVRGFGFLVPVGAGLDLLGCLFMSQLFPGRAPEGHELLQCMIGGVRHPEAVHLPDDVLLERLRADLDRTLGLRGEVQALGVARWPRAVPQPGRDHVRLVAEMRAKLAGVPGLALAGSHLDGVGVADSLASGVRAAREVNALV